jgi:putative tryptophan/tyrosine transport system substrate-binding protein
MPFDQLKRREFITLLGGAAAWPLAARAQQPAMPVVGFLRSDSAAQGAEAVAAFREVLNKGGLVEGRNVAIEFAWAEGHYDRLPSLVADLVRNGVRVIYAGGNVAIHAAKAGAPTTPIVFTTGDDPIRTGLVANLNRPGGNLTGMTMMAGTLPTKRLQLLHDVIPVVTTIAMLVDSDNANWQGDASDAQAAAQAIGLSLLVVSTPGDSNFDAIFETLAQKGVRAILVNTDTAFTLRRRQLVTLAARHQIAAIYSFRQFVEDGGLMSYGANTIDTLRQAAAYVVRILKGEKPGDLPIQAPTKFEFLVNLKTAKALGLGVPPTLLALADEVIE